MKRIVRISVLALALLAFLSCSGGKGRVIPRGKLAKIYAEMLLMDQWIDSHPTLRRTADTSFVYKPILEKYGFDEDDYRASVEKYMQDPERFARILKNTAHQLEVRHKELKALKERQDAVMNAKIEKDSTFYPKRIYFLAGMKNPTNCVEDSIVFYVDSVGGWEWRFDPVSGWDTLYRGPYLETPLRDTLDVADTLGLAGIPEPADSIAVSDSLSIAVVEAEMVESEDVEIR